MNHVQLEYGISSVTGHLKHISRVPRGLDCQCKCPECGGEFIAKKGDIMAHHFAHSREGVYLCQGYGVAHTFIHKFAVKFLKERAVELFSQHYGDSNYTSDVCGDFGGNLGKVHLEIVVHSRMKDEKLRYIKTSFNEPFRVYRIDLSREQEQQRFLSLQEYEQELFDFMFENACQIETFYELEQQRKENLRLRKTVAQAFPTATDKQLLGKVAGKIREQLGREQTKCSENVNGYIRQVNSFDRDVLFLAKHMIDNNLHNRFLKVGLPLSSLVWMIEKCNK